MSAMLRPLRRAAAPSAWQRAAAIRSLSRSLFGCSSPPSAASQETESGEQKPTPPSDQTALDDVLRPAAASDDMLPALTVLSESLGLLRESPAFQNWSATDWLMGLTVLANHNTRQRRKRRVQPRHFDSKLPTEALLPGLLHYVRVCDAVYASSTEQFCEEAHIDADTIVRSHEGGVFSPKYVLLADEERRELLLVVRGSASILDFCTDVCLVNEPFQDGQGHRGMVHAANWLVRHVEGELADLTEQYPDFDVVLTGHSLGAGVAALATMLLRPAFPSARCIAFATPASVTRELAEDCREFVTSVVNGDDCVPRLHQHSLLKLQREISRFDWRGALRDIVTEEIEEQKVELLRHKTEKLDQMRRAFHRLEQANRKQIDGAAAKLNEVKQVATENILGLSGEVDRMLSGTVDTAFASFKTDKLSVEHIDFMKKVLTLDSVGGKDRFWWTRMDDSVLLLERLSAAVKKPEELERVVTELKGLLSQADRSPPPPGDSDDPAASGEATSTLDAPQLELFRQRIDDAIDRTSTTLKEKITQQVSKVSGSVVSNVNEYVDSVKGEAEALGARIQDELDAVQDQLTRRANSVFAVAEKSLGFDTGVMLGKMEATAAVNEAASDDSKLRRKLLHEPLFPPGRILYLHREMADPAEEAVTTPTSTMTALSNPVELVEVDNDEFSRVVLSNQMLLDHLCTTYERVLKETVGHSDSTK